MLKSKYVLSLAIALIANLASAEDWYEIEVLIFEHTSNKYENPSDPELWPNDLSLAWQSPLIALNETDSANATGTVPSPYVALPTDAQSLANANYAMRVKSDYELLWHKSWKAPLLPEEDSPWILVQAGDRIEGHYRLEGALRIHLSRYLHLTNDLWLTEPAGSAMYENADEIYRTDFHWSQLPEPADPISACDFIAVDWPQTLRELPIDYYKEPAPDDWYYPFGCNVRAARERASERQSAREIAAEKEADALAAADIQSAYDSIGQATNERDASGILTNRGLDTETGVRMLGSEQNSDTPTSRFIQDGSPTVREIIHIGASRRMRSDELHYIDHPRIGIITIIREVPKPIVEAEPVEFIPAPLPSSSVTE